MEKNKIKFFLYARKSSEDKNKQVQSIDDQVSIMQEVAKRQGLKVVDVLTEVKSGKTPHGRPIFEKMLQRIRAGEANGLIVWKLDRLGRNPVDLGEIQWLLQQTTISVIVTPDKDYLPEDSSYIISVEGAGASQYIRDLSQNVKRGLKSKIDKGWMPGTAPLGYLNTKTESRGENYIIKDPERFPLLRKAWDLMLTGNYTADQILGKLNDEWGFRTRKSKRKGCKPMSRSTIYRMFTNQFYAGMIEYQLGGRRNKFGKDFRILPGKQEPMVSLEEFDQVQALLGKKGKPRPNERHEYAFTGIIHCGECGSMISVTTKQKFIKSTKQMKSYELYYCICARKHKKCSQKRYTNSNEIINQITEKISHFTIIPEFKDWAIEVLNSQEDKDFEEHNKIVETHQKALESAERKIANLTNMRLSDQIEDEEYDKERTRLKNEITILKTKTAQVNMQRESWIDLTKKAFIFAANAEKAFISGNAEVRRSILLGIGMNWTILDHSLSIKEPEWLIPFTNPIHLQNTPCEPTKKADFPREMAFSGTEKCTKRGRRDSNP